jgi:ubiquinone/menaquinone biosynthesis C-methylase UbiE
MITLRKTIKSFFTGNSVMRRELDGPDYLHRQVERSWKKESRNLRWFGLNDGMSILDMGCGPGHFTLRLADWLPNAKITALDANQSLLQQAQKRLVGRATLTQASADKTGLPAESFDFILARLLFQHLHDPLSIAREARRLLKPGGKFVVTDVDDDLFGVVDPPVRDLSKVLTRYGEAQKMRGGNRRIGRTLVRLLCAAGFVHPEIESIAIHSDDAGIEACFPQLDSMPLRSLVASGHLTRLEYSELQSARDGFYGALDPFALVLVFMACGIKQMPKTHT